MEAVRFGDGREKRVERKEEIIERKSEIKEKEVNEREKRIWLEERKLESLFVKESEVKVVLLVQ